VRHGENVDLRKDVRLNVDLSTIASELSEVVVYAERRNGAPGLVYRVWFPVLLNVIAA
jgi:hypothetical protein